MNRPPNVNVQSAFVVAVLLRYAFKLKDSLTYKESLMVSRVNIVVAIFNQKSPIELTHKLHSFIEHIWKSNKEIMVQEHEIHYFISMLSRILRHSNHRAYFKLEPLPILEIDPKSALIIDRLTHNVAVMIMDELGMSAPMSSLPGKDKVKKTKRPRDKAKVTNTPKPKKKLKRNKKTLKKYDTLKRTVRQGKRRAYLRKTQILLSKYHELYYTVEAVI